MSDANKAVFLSYASQDAEAARRICDVLRAAGVEVWFDQSELRGGDAWDAMIRKRIKECTLFVPIISTHTQARAEGYFRLEWKLAVDRSHLMADDAPFLFPVVLGDVNDATARVPDKFREVQWTRLTVKDTPETLARRIVTMLADYSPGSPPRAVAPSPQTRTTAPRARSGLPAWAWMLGGIGVAGIVVFAVISSRPPAETTAATTARTEAARPATAADKLVERAHVILNGSALSREQIDAANGLLEQAIELEPTNGAAWTAAARADLMLIYPYGYDRSEERRQRAMSRATRALNLAPDSHDTRVVKTNVMAHASGNPALTLEAEETFRRMMRERPDDKGLQLHLAEVLREQRRFEEAAALFEQIGEFELAGWSWVQAGNFATAYEPVKRAVIEKRTTTALQLKTQIELNWFEDLTLAQATINQLRPSELQSDMTVGAATRVAFNRRDPERMLQLLNTLSRDFLDSFGFVGPRQYFTGWAHHLAGRAERAKIEWRKAVTVLQTERATAPERIRLFVLEAEIHALLGETDEAERLLANAQSIANEAPGTVSVTNVGAYLALGKKEPALAWLESFLRSRTDRRIERAHADARFSPIWDGLRGDPRFETLLRETRPVDAVPLDNPPPAVGSVAPDDKSVAVLPFANLSTDKENEFFADGVHEDVLTNLANLRTVRVVSRTSVMQYRGTIKTIRQIARELGVAYVLEGSVRRAGSTIRVTGQLIDAATEGHVWAKTYDRELKDIFAVQSDLAREITDALHATLSPTELAALGKPPTRNLEAYDGYQKARVLSRSNANERDVLERIIPLLERAVALDPDYALAWADLSRNHLKLYGATDHTAARLGQARDALARAEQLAPESYDVLRAGMDFASAAHDRETVNARRRRIIELFFNRAESLLMIAGSALAERKWADARAAYRAALQFDPRNPQVLGAYFQMLDGLRRWDEAAPVAATLAEVQPDNLDIRLQAASMVFRHSGTTAQLTRLLAEIPRSPGAEGDLISTRARIAFLTGDWTGLVSLWRETGPKFRIAGFLERTTRFQVAGAFLRLDDPVSARPLLEQNREELTRQLKTDPSNVGLWTDLCVTLGMSGDRAGARAALDQAGRLIADMRLEPLQGFIVRWNHALARSWVDEKSIVINELGRLLREPTLHPPTACVAVLRVSWATIPLRGDPAFEALLNNPANNAPLFP